MIPHPLILIYSAPLVVTPVYATYLNNSCETYVSGLTRLEFSAPLSHVCCEIR